MYLSMKNEKIFESVNSVNEITIEITINVRCPLSLHSFKKSLSINPNTSIAVTIIPNIIGVAQGITIKINKSGNFFIIFFVSH